MESVAERIKSKAGFIIDMDGVIYHGNKLLPGVTAPIFHPRTTDDKFVAHIDVKDESKLNEVISSIKAAGASEVI